MKIVVLVDEPGGDIAPSEDIRRVAAAVAACLRRLGHAPVRVPVARPVALTLERIRALEPDLVFNLCEGVGFDARQEGNVAGLLELLGVPFTGNSACTLHLSLRKALVKEVLRANGVPTPGWFVAESPFLLWKRQVRFPAIVKPRREDASIGIDSGSVVRNVREMRARIDRILMEYRQGALVEEYVDGREFNVSIFGGRVLAISEIDFSRMPRSLPRIVTYRGKWDPASAEFRATVPVCPARISRRLRGEIERLAVRCWALLDARDYARVDMRLGRDGGLYVLEFNPNPDLSRDAGLARAARANGWSYRRLIGEIVRLALERTARELPETPAAAQAGGRSDA